MKDILGNELKVGDRVAYAVKNTDRAYLRIGTIESIDHTDYFTYANVRGESTNRIARVYDYTMYKSSYYTTNLVKL